LTQWIVNNHLGDWSSLFGLLFSIIGFYIVISQAFQAKTAAQAAKEAAEQTRKELIKAKSIINLSTVTREITNFKEFFKQRMWDKLSSSCNYLVSAIPPIKAGNNSLSPSDQKILQRSSLIFSDLEKELYASINAKREPDVSKLMGKVVDVTSELHELLEKIQRS
jgi:hypothetical protein